MSRNAEPLLRIRRRVLEHRRASLLRRIVAAVRLRLALLAWQLNKWWRR
jgi:hypothetical protein